VVEAQWTACEAADMKGGRDVLASWYRRYSAVCNRHALHELAPYLRDVVLVNGAERTAQGYIDGPFEVDRAFPDHRWEIRRILVDEPWVPGDNARLPRG